MRGRGRLLGAMVARLYLFYFLHTSIEMQCQVRSISSEAGCQCGETSRWGMTTSRNAAASNDIPTLE
jgi:hypothetical protein